MMIPAIYLRSPIPPPSEDYYTTAVELTCEEDEHIHSDSCYMRLICTNDDAEHIHEATCYEYTDSPICGQNEHTHGEECYTESNILVCDNNEEISSDVPSILSCEKEEIALHCHTDECFDENENLICGKMQVLEHQHSEECFTTEEIPVDTEVLTCTIQEGDGAHSHDETCYDENGVLICEIDETSGHQHGSRCYGIWKLICGQTEHIHDEECKIKSVEKQIFNYMDESGRYELVLTVTGVLPEDAQLCVEMMDDIEMLQTMSDDSFEDSLDVSELDVYFLTGDGSVVDTSECTMTAELTWSTNSGIERLSLDDSEKQEQFGELLVWNVDDEVGLVPVANVIYSLDEQTISLDMPMCGERIVVQMVDATQIIYTAQYYGYTLQGHQYNANNPVEGDVKGLPVINTANGGNNKGGTLPVNGTTPSTFDMPLKNVGTADSPVYMLNSTDTLTMMYKDATQTYAEAPNVFYLDKLAESTGYSLSEIWLLNENGVADSNDPSDWVVYNADTVHFTSRPEFAAGHDDLICIQNGTVVRMVYTATEDYFDSTATFYDYDITGQNSSTEWYNTDRQGINAQSNYFETGAKLAFGNQNTGTGREDEQLNGYYINKANKDTVYKLCSFGIVQSLDENGHLVYSNGVDAPNLFNDGAANGKYTYENSSLTFKRYGDNYTLYSVSVPNAGSVTNLNQFTNPTGWSSSGYNTYTSIFTNNFWPVDNATNREDPNFGNHNDPKYYSSGKKSFPVSDDDKAHNSYFGMQYSVSFNLTADYVGPLNYLFYGDDDMWVFLTYPNGSSKLICDIGGVHSSVGQYVDLWDWMDKENAEGTYKLTFFYTERGASGSTCYMSFTLPSVFGVNIQQETSDLTVRKNVQGETDSDKEFDFYIHFYDAAGNEIKDDYLYTRYSSEGEIVNSDLVICDGATFSLKDGEYIHIRGLPYGLRYTITETSHDGYTVFNSVNGVVSTGTTAQGTIMLDVAETVEFTNTVNTVNGLTLQKIDSMGKTLTGAEFELKDSKETFVQFVDNGNGTYTVPDSVADYIETDTKYYLALSMNEEWVIGTDDADNAVLRQKDAGIAVKLIKNEDGSYTIFDANDVTRRLNVKGGNYNQGDTVMFFQSAQDSPTENEKWLLVTDNSGNLTIKPRNAVLGGSDMVLDLNAASVSDGNKIHIWESNGTGAQKWKLIPVGSDVAETVNTLAVGGDGRLSISNLAPGTYTLTETKAPLNCVGLSQSVEFSVAKDGTVTVIDDSNGEVFVDSDNVMQINVVNDYKDQILNLKKLVEITGTTAQEFEFKITWRLDESSEDTIETVKLKHDENIELKIPYGATVTIEEPNHDGYSLQFKSGETIMDAPNGKLTITMNSDVSIIAINARVYELPATGGSGTAIFYVMSSILILGAVTLLIAKKRMRVN